MGGIWGCAAFLVTGPLHCSGKYKYWILYSQDNKFYCFFQSRASEPWAFTKNQRKAKAHYPHSKRVETQGVSRRALSYEIIWGRKKLKTNACAHMPFLAPGFQSSESKFAVERAGIRSAVACQCSLDTSIVLWGAFCKNLSTQKDCKFIFIYSPQPPNVALITHFSTPASCRSHAGTPA